MGNHIMMRDQVGGNIRGTTPGFFELYENIYSINWDNHVMFISPVKTGVSWSLSGVTKDSTGVALGSCHVDLFYTNNDVLVGETTSDPTTGAFSFLIGPNAGTFYLVAYKAGSPAVAGTTVNTLTPVAI